MPSLPVVLALKPLLRKLRDIPFEQRHERAVLTFAYGITVTVSDTTNEETFGNFLQGYESVAGTKINADKSGGLLMDT